MWEFSVVDTKFLSMFGVGICSFLVGIAPACYISCCNDNSNHTHQHRPGIRLLLSSLLCFGGGVLLATSLLHMLPEVRESLPHEAELVYASGFLFLYFVDEVVHWFSREKSNTTRSSYSTRTVLKEQQAEINARRREAESKGVPGCTDCAHDYQVLPKPFEFNNQNNYNGIKFEPSAPMYRRTRYGSIENMHITDIAGAADTIDNTGHDDTLLCHGNHDEPCATTTHTGLIGLLVALTLHAILEGLAIGLQLTVSEVLLLVATVASHKLVVGFCLGMELAGTLNSVIKQVLAISFFSGGSSLGIGVGMLVLRINKAWMNVVIPILRGLAGGSLLYATVSEVLPRERARWHSVPGHASAGIIQFLSVLGGFLLMYLINNFMIE
ncbi:uncharacterized protein LOC107265018 [Cephus cinctus]|uniref:Uncharacterized protein LOC107265018 n=1 Tax=Cephus cinctus TaxID=211228 RepID=A0AAJ7VYB3_CEPCN|nr:uncharacterized protein LOC107265018 [Cephus cinctus]XP_024937715.1 uncharacterized protein LOC107265018 [Cephus cinctus]